ncbi:MAG: hypothetical protein JKX98_00240 [Alcanivoracaceae bacterium]|nr:hypothetical protein [Alcanivoracaceae bacterium]
MILNSTGQVSSLNLVEIINDLDPCGIGLRVASGKLFLNFIEQLQYYN